MPRYRIRFTGPVSRGIVAWLQLLIPVLRQTPEDIEVDIEIKHREVEDAADSGPDPPAGPRSGSGSG